MPPLRAVFMMASPIHGGDINSALLIQINGGGWGLGHSRGRKSFGRGEGFESY